jgi:superfamily I DNA/RNA helicase
MDVNDVVEYLTMTNNPKNIAALVSALHSEDQETLREIKKQIDFRLKRLEMEHQTADGKRELLKDIDNAHLISLIRCALRGHRADGTSVIYAASTVQAFAMEYRYRGLSYSHISEYFDPEWALDLMENAWILNTGDRFEAARKSQTLHTEPEPDKSMQPS